MARLVLPVLLALALLHAGCGEAPEPALRTQAVVRLKTALQDADRGVRYAAVTALGKAGAGPDEIGALLKDPAWCVRQEAAWWLRAAGAQALPLLQDTLTHGSPESRASAAWALSGFGAAGVPLLRQALADPELSVRLEALSAIRRLGGPAGAPLADDLAASLTADSRPPEERYEAALALCEVAPDQAGPALPLLVAEARDGNFHGGGEALKALLKCEPGPELIAALDDASRKRIPALRKELAWEARRLVPRPPPPEPPIASESTPAPVVVEPGAVARLSAREPRERMLAALDLGRAGADAGVLAPALDDDERDVRRAAAMALGTAVGDVEGPLLKALDDANWRVRAAAIRSLGRRHVGAKAVAPFLADPVFAVALAAHDALRLMGPAAAVPVAEQMASANYAVLHYAVSIFDGAGPEGAPAAGLLSGLLAHADPNVREAAARCLASVGCPGRSASASLVHALGDERLSVVSHVALALGSQGLTQDLLAALDDKRARVRAYAAFAVGWALGEERHLDQVPFEVRLPVLDVGVESNLPSREGLANLDDDLLAQRVPLLLRGIWSADPAVSVRCASLLEYEQLGAVESERVMELLLPEGLRRGSVVDFDRMRSTIGSSELCACLIYLVRARRTAPHRERIFSHFHRIARAEHLSPLCWFRRTHELESLEGDGYAGANIWMPAAYTTASAQERATLWLGYDPGPDEPSILRAFLSEFLRDPEGGLAQPELWLLNRFRPRPGDSDLLLRVAGALEKGVAWHEEKGAYLATLRALGRCIDDDSRAYLRGVADTGEAERRYVSLAGLLRRGDQAAGKTLVALSRGEQDAFLVLMEVAPRRATQVLADLLSHPESVGGGLALLGDWSTATTALGVEFPAEAFLGLESAVASAALGPVALGRILIRVPGCRTRRIARLLFAGLEVSADFNPVREDDESGWGDLEADEVGAVLHAADPARFLLLLRRWAKGNDETRAARTTWARAVLLRLADKPSASLLITWVRENDPDLVDEFLVERLGGPEAEAFFVDMSLDESEPEHVRDSALETLAQMRGWPLERPLRIDRDFPAELQQQARDWIRAGRMDKVRAAWRDEQVPTPVWERLLAATKAGDAGARAALWSVMRAGRYRWCQRQDDLLRTLGVDWTTLPHWVSDLDSNCCRVSDGLEAFVFEDALGLPVLWGSQNQGVGQPLSQRATTWFSLMGGRWIYSPLVERWIAEPE